MTKITKTEMIESLMFVRQEIARINDAAGHTMFNPGATDHLEMVLLGLGADKATVKAIRNRHGNVYA
jgi:hypothetical protein